MPDTPPRQLLGTCLSGMGSAQGAGRHPRPRLKCACQPELREGGLPRQTRLCAGSPRASPSQGSLRDCCAGRSPKRGTSSSSASVVRNDSPEGALGQHGQRGERLGNPHALPAAAGGTRGAGRPRRAAAGRCGSRRGERAENHGQQTLAQRRQEAPGRPSSRAVRGTEQRPGHTLEGARRRSTGLLWNQGRRRPPRLRGGHPAVRRTRRLVRA